MLRNVLITILSLALALLILGSVALKATPVAPILALTIILFGLLFERHRYIRLNAGAPEGRFKATAEKFLDPETGSPVTVYQDPVTGEHRYITTDTDQ